MKEETTNVTCPCTCNQLRNCAGEMVSSSHRIRPCICCATNHSTSNACSPFVQSKVKCDSTLLCCILHTLEKVPCQYLAFRVRNLARRASFLRISSPIGVLRRLDRKLALIYARMSWKMATRF